jgi:hypothetical protein
MRTDNTFEILVRKLAEYYKRIGLRVISAVGIDGFPLPKLIKNEGFGDQRPKQPHIVGYNETNGEMYIGIVKTISDNLESASALTEYDLYLNLSNEDGKIRLCVYLPVERIQEFNSLITRYLHPDYYDKIVIVTYSDNE